MCVVITNRDFRGALSTPVCHGLTCLRHQVLSSVRKRTKYYSSLNPQRFVLCLESNRQAETSAVAWISAASELHILRIQRSTLLIPSMSWGLSYVTSPPVFVPNRQSFSEVHVSQTLVLEHSLGGGAPGLWIFWNSLYYIRIFKPELDTETAQSFIMMEQEWLQEINGSSLSLFSINTGWTFITSKQRYLHRLRDKHEHTHSLGYFSPSVETSLVMNSSRLSQWTPCAQGAEMIFHVSL